MVRDWFDWYCNQLNKEKEAAKFKNRFLCPCCYMPTLKSRGGFSICPICFWEDDGQDSDDADVIRGGPNGSYSLKEARLNFENYQTMYRKEDAKPFERQQANKEKRMELYNAFSNAILSNYKDDWSLALKVEKAYKSY